MEKFLELAAEKIGRKQLIAIVGMLVLAQMTADRGPVLYVALAGIAAQLINDLYKARIESRKSKIETSDVPADGPGK